MSNPKKEEIAIELAKIIAENNQAEKDRSDALISALRGDKVTKLKILAKVTGHYADLLETAFLDNEFITPREALTAMEEFAKLKLKEHEEKYH